MGSADPVSFDYGNLKARVQAVEERTAGQVTEDVFEAKMETMNMKIDTVKDQLATLNGRFWTVVGGLGLLLFDMLKEWAAQWVSSGGP